MNCEYWKEKRVNTEHRLRLVKAGSCDNLSSAAGQSLIRSFPNCIAMCWLSCHLTYSVRFSISGCLSIRWRQLLFDFSCWHLSYGQQTESQSLNPGCNFIAQFNWWNFYIGLQEIWNSQHYTFFNNCQSVNTRIPSHLFFPQVDNTTRTKSISFETRLRNNFVT